MKAVIARVGLAAIVFGLWGASAGCAADSTAVSQSSPTSATSTTLAPGVMTFDTMIDRFERLISREDLPGTLPYSPMATEELAWLSDAAQPFVVTGARGYRLANGDLVMLFFVDPRPWRATDEASRNLVAAAGNRYPRGNEAVWAHLDGDFGFVVVSLENRRELGRLAQWARQAPQPVIDGE